MDDSMIDQGFEMVDAADATQTIIEKQPTTTEQESATDNISNTTGGDDFTQPNVTNDEPAATIQVVEAKTPQTKPASTHKIATKKLSPKTIRKAPKKQSTKVQNVGVFSQLPEPVLGLALYTDPMKSASAVSILAMAYALATVDFGYTLPFLLLRLLNTMLVIVLGVTLGLMANEKFIVKSPTPKTTSPAEDVFKPILQKIESDFNILWGNSTESDSLVVSWVKQTGAAYLESLYCTKPLRTIKTIIVVHFASKLVRCCSFASLFLIGVCLFFTVPLLYKKNKAQIDPVALKIKHTFDVVNDISTSMFKTKPKVKLT
eukprot:m.181885 g.181885  ORF g.181885 m.181885 type:complete len:317 (+) comp32085_c1_seq1:290-1240(+)